jgi:uncharacterized GH25 family protein
MITVRSLSAAAAVFLAVSLPAAAHEFWVEPESYAIAASDSLNADLRNGQFFAGPTIPYLPATIARFEVISGDEALPVTSRLGNRPALMDMSLPEGLAIVVFESNDSRLNYQEWEKFAAFVEHKDLKGIIEAHRARGLPESNFDENYRRFSKALVAVGDGRGADRQVGLLTEIVAGANPYTDDVTAGMPLQVFYDGEPRADAQIELFERAPDDTVTTVTYRTDAEGRAVVPVKPGHVYLADSVAIRPLDGATGNGAVWHTDWAALTFAVPE